MDTPICDFVKRYNQQNTVRLHMPGHKGKCILGFEQNDITEISGADNLYQSEGIIAQSERNASSLFGCQTYYSTEGSSLCIRAMMYLAMLYAKEQNKELLVYSGRNTHKSFISACALLDFDFEWITPQKDCDPFYSSSINAEKLDNDLLKNPNKIKVVYITSPDYLGNVSDIKTISKICKKHGALLFVDNAHGAYLKFLNPSQHPIDLGADLCCDSAHKTLPVLTGGAYFHVCNNAPSFFKKYAKNALSLFGSTSPSYLILQSLDTANRYISQDYPKMHVKKNEFFGTLAKKIR